MRAVAVALLLAALPTVARAHLVSSGMGVVYDGVLHPLTSLSDILPLLGLAVWAGGRGQRAGRWAVCLLPLGWLLGGVVGGSIIDARPWAVAAFVASLLAGVAGAARLRMPDLPVGIAVAMVGAVMSAAEAAADPPADRLVALGGACAAGALMLVLVGQVTALRGTVAPVVARVAASWVAAASLLQLGWFYRGYGL